MPRRELSLDGATRAKDLTGNIYIVTGANSGVGRLWGLRDHPRPGVMVWVRRVCLLRNRNLSLPLAD